MSLTWHPYTELCSCGHQLLAHTVKGHPDFRVRATSRCSHVSGVNGVPCGCAGWDHTETIFERREVRKLPVGVDPNAGAAK